MKDNIPAVPFAKSYWVVPGRFLAGAYPTLLYFEEQNRTRIGNLLDAGIRVFIDLTTPGQLEPYESILYEQAGWHDVETRYHRFAIKNYDIPSEQNMVVILNIIDAALQDGQGIYVHCWEGIGRTGTVVGCYLVRHGMTGPAALEEIARLRKGMPNAWLQSPESDSQFKMILSWENGK